MVMKAIFDDGDSEKLTESEMQPLYMTTERLSDFTRWFPQDAIDTLPAELRELLNADSDADSDAKGVVARVVEGNPSGDCRSDIDGEGDAGAGHVFSIGTSSAVQPDTSAASANMEVCAEALDK
eukprot:jgi/Tetstr1/434925/TSEL_023922.t1